jgi:hypothetical protein
MLVIQRALHNRGLITDRSGGYGGMPILVTRRVIFV